MTAVIQQDNIRSYCDKVLSEVMPYENEYFTSLKNKEMTKEEFTMTQQQFYYAVSFFSRPMTALMARFSDPMKRLSILENIVEEHGSFTESAFHESTFREFLQIFNVDNSQLENLELWPEVRAFNSALMTACVFDEAEVGVGCLGAIEYMFANISGIIGESVVNNGWCSQENLKHYKLHAEIDIQHALDFFMIVEDSWGDEKKKYFIKQGIDMGIYIFNRLYKDLRAASKKVLYT